MGKDSKIEWTDHTVNLWWGCSKVHTGCKNCYAEYFSDVRYKKNLWGKESKRQRIKSAFSDLDKYQRKAAEEDKISKIFCGSMMDIFEEDSLLHNPDELNSSIHDLRVKLFNKINNGEYNNLIFLFLTKRPENILNSIPAIWINKIPKNVWFGVSISNQKTADRYLEIMQQLNFDNLFLSLEPQIGGIDLFSFLKKVNIKWIIQGGESGHKRRSFEIKWAYDILTQCRNFGIAYFFKQIDKIQPIPSDLIIREFPIMEKN